mmetsp:Transcript_77498/g.250758  ORF Transcript_77498/g.250758 Transcript_77498/m.250758 type:complete len:114 (-) Transcript_77498:99-440(-)
MTTALAASGCEEAGVLQESLVAAALFVLGYLLFLPRFGIQQRVLQLMEFGAGASAPLEGLYGLGASAAALPAVGKLQGAARGDQEPRASSCAPCPSTCSGMAVHKELLACRGG